MSNKASTLTQKTGFSLALLDTLIMSNFPFTDGMKLFLEHSDEQKDNNVICSLSDEKGTILYVNNHFCDISGYNESELVGANHNIVNSGLHTRDFFKSMWSSIGKGNIWQGEIRNKKKDNTFYWVDTIIFPTTIGDDKKRKYFSIRTVIDDKKQAEERKLERIEELEQLLHTISHQMRQPITQIMGLIEVIGQNNIVNPTTAEAIKMLISSAENLNEYTRNLSKQVEYIALQDKIA